MKILLMTDSCSDLPIEYTKENDIFVFPLTYHFKGEDHVDDFGTTLSYSDFYAEVRKGEMSSTSQVNTYTFKETFKKFIDQGYSLVYIAFSSALSGTYNNAMLAKEEITSENPTADISVIDSRCASMGLGLLVYTACQKLKDGMTKEDLVAWIEANKLKLNHWFTVDDLFHLKRGGRVSATSAVIGSLLDIKPILHVDDEGRLIPVAKTKGRKRSIRTLANELNDRITNAEDQFVAISHGDCYEDAKLLEKLILEQHKVKGIIINYVGPVVGSHSGPGTMALFFFGENRHI